MDILVRRVLLSWIAAIGLCMVNVDDARAGEPLPPALEAAGVTPSQLLAPSETEQVRASGGLFDASGTVVQFATGFRSRNSLLLLQAMLAGQEIGMRIDRRGLQTRAAGIAVVGPATRKQGLLITRPPAPPVRMVISGDAERVDLVVLPGLFQAAFGR